MAKFSHDAADDDARAMTAELMMGGENETVTMLHLSENFSMTLKGPRLSL